MKRAGMLAGMLTLLIAMCLPTAAEAHTDDGHSPEVWKLIEKQALINLNSPHKRVRTQAYKNVIMLASLYRDKVDLEPVAKDLIATLREGPRSDRELALAALQAVGGQRAERYIARNVTEEEKRRCRERIAAVLHEQHENRVARRAEEDVAGRSLP